MTPQEIINYSFAVLAGASLCFMSELLFIAAIALIAFLASGRNPTVEPKEDE